MKYIHNVLTMLIHLVCYKRWFLELIIPGAKGAMQNWQVLLLNGILFAGSFKSQLIDYFRGHIVFREAFGRFMLIRTK